MNTLDEAVKTDVLKVWKPENFLLLGKRDRPYEK